MVRRHSRRIIPRDLGHDLDEYGAVDTYYYTCRRCGARISAKERRPDKSVTPADNAETTYNAADDVTVQLPSSGCPRCFLRDFSDENF